MIRTVLIKQITQPVKYRNYSLFEWVNMMFNKPDMERIKEFGPDRACAEWLLRNGGAVRWVGETELAKDYNKLPKSTAGRYIEEIDASGSSISHYGFSHLSGCKKIKKIIIHKCSYISDAAIEGLSHVESPLKYLQISSCHNISDDGLKKIPQLETLENLILYNLPEVTNLPECATHLRKMLPNCNVDITDKSK